ncbi:MAG: hypothetical protein DCC55_40925, partial [Chloroflexi bacterium]
RLDAGLLLADLDLDPPGLDDFVTVPGWGFQIGRYPVTNKQYRRFVEAGGYIDDRWWQDEEGRRYRDEENWAKPRYWDNLRFNRTTQPVVGVSWYEANAYCAWLTHDLRQAGTITVQEEVRLPTQAEWEQAARSHDGRDYPWGSDFFPANANTEESNLQQTTPVHMYAAAATPEGVCDLSGNVWEWTNDVDTDGLPWLKGGSWLWEADRAASAARLGLSPVDGYFNLGFRCVVVPISRASF